MAESKEDYSKKLCTKCEQPDNKATVYCEDCKYYLCQSCYDGHKSWEAMKDHRIDTIDDLISGKVTLSEEEEEWDQIGQFKVPGMSGPSGIAVTSDEKIGVVEWGGKAKVVSKSGDILHTLEEGCNDLAVTSGNGFLVPDRSFCRVYDSNGKKVSEFRTLNLSEKYETVTAMTVDKNGNIIFGMNKIIAIWKVDGSFKSGYPISTRPDGIAVTSTDKIIVANPSDGLVMFKSYFSGKKPLTPFAPPPDIKKWRPVCLCCSKKDELFVTNGSGGDPVGIYKYAASGAYIGCVTTDVKKPKGIALSNDDQELYVVDEDSKSVKIFEKP
ncbi:uncharacterized protein [Amphiura filiformis]|uniref:uncharacterized protein n=1 Tax=Amphiura filiformis TaxID=82378 RepID=UPI003B21E918